MKAHIEKLKRALLQWLLLSELRAHGWRRVEVDCWERTQMYATGAFTVRMTLHEVLSVHFKANPLP